MQIRVSLHLFAIIASIFLLTSCIARSPFVVLTIEDPDGVAAGWTVLAVGTTIDTMQVATQSSQQLPLNFTVTSRTVGRKTLWVEARDGSGKVLARGKTEATFARTGTPTANVSLRGGCMSTADCDDGLYCTGQESCVEGQCEVGTQPCGSSFACVTNTCLELGAGLGTCNIVADHSKCSPGQYCNPAVGCVQGKGCQTDDDCRDEFACNGTELCVNLVCTAGLPPLVDDADLCTLDGCDDRRAERGLDAVFHVALASLDGVACTLPASNPAAQGVCVSAKNGCAVSECGDGVVDVSLNSEVCDDGAANRDGWSSEVACASDCGGWAPHCGDGVVDGGFETCDDGDNNDDLNGCDADCQRNDDCGDGVVQSLFEQCDDGDADECNGCRTDCQRGCICTAPAACSTGTWCSSGACSPCDTAEHCGPACALCSGTTPLCGGDDVGCVCDADPGLGVRGSCAPGSWCDGGICAACSNASRCGQTCVVCGGDTPACGGAEAGCVVDPGEGCLDKPDFTPCQVPTVPDRSYDICVQGLCVSPGPAQYSDGVDRTAVCQTEVPASGLWYCSTPGLGFRLPDTGDRLCYSDFWSTPCGGCGEIDDSIPCPGVAGDATCGATAFCGQDAQYGWDTLHQQADRFTRVLAVADEPMVIDNVTELIWQGCPLGRRGSNCSIGAGGDMVWQDAFAYCDGLTWAGYADWRLPDRFELQSIANYGSSALIDEAAFPSPTAAGSFWSSTFLGFGVIGPSWAWFSGAGQVRYGSVESTYKARCVRGRPAIAPLDRYARTESAEPVVADNLTHLMWQGCEAGLSGSDCTVGLRSRDTWENALAYCEDLAWSGHTDWYLPDIDELQSTLESGPYGPGMDLDVFPEYSWGPPVWSSSAEAGWSFGVWSVEPATGDVLLTSKSGPDNTQAFRCVRADP
jgi:hypothetical protein